MKERGQIAHLDGDRSHSVSDNLAWLCLDHHAWYDSKSYQAKGLTIHETKKYREQLYQAIDEMRLSSWPQGIHPIDLDVPLLDFSRSLDPIPGIPYKGIQLTDKNPDGRSGPPLLYTSIYFKTTPLFVDDLPSAVEKWLYIQLELRPAFSLRIQVRAWNDRDVIETMGVLRSREGSWLLQSLRTNDDRFRDHLYLWREVDQNRLMASTYSPTFAALSIHARFSDRVANDLADYLDDVGFTKPFTLE